MPDAPIWRILFVDDDEHTRTEVRELLEGTDYGAHGSVSVDVLANFDEALARLEAERIDILILDVWRGPPGEHGNDVGIATLRAVQERCFVPVIFYTALPTHVDTALLTRFVRCVEKTEPGKLVACVGDILDSRVPAVNRALVRHLEHVQRDYMWQFVARYWDDLGAKDDAAGLAYLLARRLAVSLSDPGIGRFIEQLGGSNAAAVAAGRVHPAQYYILPPIDEPPWLTGDVLHGDIKGRTGYWLLLTPSCDMVPARQKADHVLLATCDPLTDEKEYVRWREEGSRAAEDALGALVRNHRDKAQRDRHFFLPPAMQLPALIADLQALVIVPAAEFPGALRRVASLDMPFAANVAAQFTRLLARLGTPDLDVEATLNALRPPGASGGAGAAGVVSAPAPRAPRPAGSPRRK